MTRKTLSLVIGLLCTTGVAAAVSPRGAELLQEADQTTARARRLAGAAHRAPAAPRLGRTSRRPCEASTGPATIRMTPG